MEQNTVSTHTPTRGATVLGDRTYYAQYVSTHTPTRGATEIARDYGVTLRFLLTPLHEGRRDFVRMSGTEYSFYSHPYTRGDGFRRQNILCTVCFYSHPYTRGDDILSQCELVLPVSTHTPTRGATLPTVFPAATTRVSTHTPTRGATERELVNEEETEFLLTPLHEGRRENIMRDLQTKTFLLTPLHEGRPNL